MLEFRIPDDVPFPSLATRADVASAADVAAEAAARIARDLFHDGQIEGLQSSMQPKAERGFTYAPVLGGKIPLQFLPNFSPVNGYKGLWDANANVPEIPAAAPGNLGWLYIVGTPGFTVIDGHGALGWHQWEGLVSNGAEWEFLPAPQVPPTASFAARSQQVTGGMLLKAVSLPTSRIPSLAPPSARRLLYITDLGGGPGHVEWNGSGWRRLARGEPTLIAGATATFNYFENSDVIFFSDSFSGTRVLTLPLTKVGNGALFSLRTINGAAGQYSLNSIGFADHTWGEFVAVAGAWQLKARGTF